MAQFLQKSHFVGIFHDIFAVFDAFLPKKCNFAHFLFSGGNFRGDFFKKTQLVNLAQLAQLAQLVQLVVVYGLPQQARVELERICAERSEAVWRAQRAFKNLGVHAKARLLCVVL